MASCVHSSKSYNNSHKEDNYYYNGIEGIDYVILPYDPIEFEWITLAFKEGIPVRLTTDEIINLDEYLEEAVHKYNTETKTPSGNDVKQINLSKYNRQYIAIINKDGEKEVFINCFFHLSMRDSEHWKNNFVFILDGGYHYFQIKINMERKLIMMFSVNGYAYNYMHVAKAVWAPKNRSRVCAL
jgi:hypothetical protein